MDFGAFPAHRPFDSRLPPLEPNGVRRLGGVARGDARIEVGAPQWNMPEWIGRVYPPRTKASAFLETYSRQWRAIELNTSFYRVPTPEQAKSWADRTPDDFRFSVKIHQGLSHDAEAWASASVRRARIAGFVAAWSAMGEKWAESFLQLPPNFSFGDFGRLRAWGEEWPKEFPLHIEFRHPSWFSDRQIRKEATDWLVEHAFGAVITDTPGRRDASHGTVTTDRLLVRFLAQSMREEGGLLDSDRQRIATWAKRMAGLVSRGLRVGRFYLHDPGLYYVPELTWEFAAALENELSLAGLPTTVLGRTPSPIPAPRGSPGEQPSLFG